MTNINIMHKVFFKYFWLISSFDINIAFWLVRGSTENFQCIKKRKQKILLHIMCELGEWWLGGKMVPKNVQLTAALHALTNVTCPCLTKAVSKLFKLNICASMFEQE